MPLPEWWSWEFEFSSHLLKRMVDRGFNETDLRTMLETVRRIDVDTDTGRCIASVRFESQDWEIVLEPESAERRVVVITAYPLD